MSRGRFLLVGEAPAPDRTKRHLRFALACAAYGCRPSRAALDNMVARARPLFEFVRRCDEVNVLDAWPGYDGRGSAFPIEAARARIVPVICAALSRERYARILLCGGRVTRSLHHAFANEPRFDTLNPLYPHLDFFKPGGHFWSVAVSSVPHPSGSNGFWNLEDNRQECLRYLVSIARE